jgi:hypothetical protein
MPISSNQIVITAIAQAAAHMFAVPRCRHDAHAVLVWRLMDAGRPDYVLNGGRGA